MTELLRYMKSRWSDILDIPESEIQETDTFFELGGTALQLYIFLYQLETYLEKKINVPLFVKKTTLCEMELFLRDNVKAFEKALYGSVL